MQATQSYQMNIKTNTKYLRVITFYPTGGLSLKHRPSLG